MQTLIDAYKNDLDVNDVAAKMHMPSCTARTIINKYRKNHSYTGPKKRGGAFRVLYDRESVLSLLVAWLCDEQHVHATLKQMSAYITSVMGKAPCKSTLALWIEHEILFIARPRPVPSNPDLSRIMDDRHAYASFRLRPNTAAHTSDIIYIGVHTLSIWARRAKAGGTGFSCTKQVLCFMAVSPAFGPLCCVAGDHPASQFQQFLVNATATLAARGGSTSPILISDEVSLMDAACNSTWISFTSRGSLTSWVLPAHSPLLNPFDTIINDHVSRVRQAYTAGHKSMVTKLEALRTQGGEQEGVDVIGEEDRFFGPALAGLVAQGWAALVPNDVISACARCDSYLDKCRDRQLIELYA